MSLHELIRVQHEPSYTAGWKMPGDREVSRVVVLKEFKVNTGNLCYKKVPNEEPPDPYNLYIDQG